MADGTSSAALATSFIHFEERMSLEISTVPAARSTDATSCSRPAVAGCMLPIANHDFSGGLCRSTTPGSNMFDDTSMTAPSVRSMPMISAMSSSCMPFCRPTTSPSGATSGRMSSLAHRVSYALTSTKTRSNCSRISAISHR